MLSKGKDVSDDLDFIEEGPVSRQTVREVLAKLGFRERGRHFVHEGSKYFVEFPNGPLMVRDQRIERVAKRRTRAGVLRLLSPTDCVKDRLAAFFYWHDRQSFDQALLVARARKIDLREIRRWARCEGQNGKFRRFESAMNELKSVTRKSKPKAPASKGRAPKKRR